MHATNEAWIQKNKESYNSVRNRQAIQQKNEQRVWNQQFAEEEVFLVIKKMGEKLYLIGNGKKT